MLCWFYEPVYVLIVLMKETFQFLAGTILNVWACLLKKQRNQKILDLFVQNVHLI